jgi:polysaccharide biosynthesis/export protein
MEAANWSVAIRPMPQYVIEPPDILQIDVVDGDSTNRKSTSSTHLVAPDGRVNLDEWGTVYVSGMTISEAQAAIKKAVSNRIASPQVIVDVFAYNSKRYYVIWQTDGGMATVQEFPITGNESVLDAIAKVGGINMPGAPDVLVLRRAPNGVGSEKQLTVDWAKIASGKSTATNHRLLPGDRVVISAQPNPSATN